MLIVDFHLLTTIWRLVYARFIYYNTICGLSFINSLFQNHWTLPHRLFKQDLLMGGFTSTHQEESSVQYFTFVYSHLKTSKFWIFCTYCSSNALHLSYVFLCHVKQSFIPYNYSLILPCPLTHYSHCASMPGSKLIGSCSGFADVCTLPNIHT